MGVPRATRFSTTMALARRTRRSRMHERTREFLEIVADRRNDHVSKVIEEDARRFAKTLPDVGNSRSDFETDRERHSAVNKA